MTDNHIRPVAIFLLVLIISSLTLIRVRSETNSWTREELNYAIRVATTDATSVMVNEDYLMDGNTNDYEKVTVNLDRAKSQFEASLRRNLGAAVDNSEINSMNIPIVGYVGYRYIYAILENATETVGIDGEPLEIGETGGQTFPWGYTYMVHEAGKDPDLNYTIYNFTLGDKIYVYKAENGVTTDEVLNINDLPEHFFSPDQTNKDFATITIMQNINEFLNAFSNTEYSLQAMNAGSGLTFNLGTVDYVGDDASKITGWSSVIDGPGFFAVVDMFDPQLTGSVRTFTFGGAEFISRY